MEKHWLKVKEIFAGALLIKPEARREYISQQCKNDKDLLREVETLLNSHEISEGFMDSPAIGEVAEEVHNRELGFGESLKQYQIIRELGTGGMGEVYLAEDKHLGRKVAIKILNKSFSKDVHNLRRFLREAKMASSLNHPSIMIVHEIGISDGLHYIVTEYIEGETLYNYVQTHNTSFVEIIDLCIQICKALGIAHSAGIIHRDIKPENIMVREDGLLKILDFGLAKHTHITKSDVRSNAQAQDIVSTQKGMIMGTAAYMSPEQARGKVVSSQTDIWSLGVVLYQLLARKLPFSGETTSDIIASILRSEPPRLVEFVSNVPGQLEELIQRSLEKNPKDRFPTSGVFLEELKKVRNILKHDPNFEVLNLKFPIGTNPENKTAYELTAITDNKTNGFFSGIGGFVSNGMNKVTSGSNALLGFLLGAAILIGFLLFGWSYLSPDSAPSAPLSSPRFTKLTNERLPSPISSLSPDGKLIAYVGQKQGMESLRIRQVTGSGTSEIVAPANVEFGVIAFSPDGEHIFYSLVQANNESGMYEIPTLGGTPRLLEKSLSRHTAAVSPDQASIAFIENGSLLILVDLSSGTRRVVSKALPGEFWYGISWHPDGKSIAGSITDSNKDVSHLYNISLESGLRQEIRSSTPWKYAYELAWLYDGSGIIVSGHDQENSPRQIWHLSFPEGKAERITNDTNSYFGISVTKDGKSLLTTKIESDRSLWLSGNKYKKYGEKIEISKTKNEGLLGVSFVPGNRILFTVTNSKGSNIWSVNRDGSDSRQLTFESYLDFFPKISPDGRHIVFISNRSGNNDLWRMNIDGTDLVQVTDTPEQESFPSYSPDGRTVVYQLADRNNDVTVWKVEIFSRVSVQLSKDPARRPVISENGEFVACVYGFGDQIAPDSIAVYSINGGKPLQILDLPQVVKSSFIRWSDNGNGLIYVDKRNGADNLWEQSFDSKPPKQLTDFDSHDINAFDISIDRKNFILSRGEQFYDLVIIGDLN